MPCDGSAPPLNHFVQKNHFEGALTMNPGDLVRLENLSAGDAIVTVLHRLNMAEMPWRTKGPKRSPICLASRAAGGSPEYVVHNRAVPPTDAASFRTSGACRDRQCRDGRDKLSAFFMGELLLAAQADVEAMRGYRMHASGRVTDEGAGSPELVRPRRN